MCGGLNRHRRAVVIDDKCSLWVILKSPAPGEVRFRAFSFPVDDSRGSVIQAPNWPHCIRWLNAGKLRSVKFTSLPFGKERATPLRAHVEQKRIVPRLPDHFGFAYLKGTRSERQCGQSTAAMRTGSAQNGQSLMPLAGITIPTVCLGQNISRPATRSEGSDDPATIQSRETAA
jgi:hypothetical protein